MYACHQLAACMCTCTRHASSSIGNAYMREDKLQIYSTFTLRRNTRTRTHTRSHPRSALSLAHALISILVPYDSTDSNCFSSANDLRITSFVIVFCIPRKILICSYYYSHYYYYCYHRRLKFTFTIQPFVWILFRYRWQRSSHQVHTATAFVSINSDFSIEWRKKTSRVSFFFCRHPSEKCGTRTCLLTCH